MCTWNTWHDSPKVNVFCSVGNTEVCSPFFFKEGAITGNVYLDMLQNFLITDWQRWSTRICIFLAGWRTFSFLHWCVNISEWHFPDNWVGQGGPHSPDSTPLVYFLWGYVRDKVYHPPLPTSMDDLRNSIRGAITDVLLVTLCCVWEEMEYQWDICYSTAGSHIEILLSTKTSCIWHIITVCNLLYIMSVHFCILWKL